MTLEYSCNGIRRPTLGGECERCSGTETPEVVKLSPGATEREEGENLKDSHKTSMTNAKMKIATATLAFLFSLALISSIGGTEKLRNQAKSQPQNARENDTQVKSKVVYVCAYMKTKSCT
jgi:hypothetical protein